MRTPVDAPHEVPVPPSWFARHRDNPIVAGVAFAARAVVVVWAAGRFPAAADGFYYHTIARRIAEGLGSTWLWPDGAVTYAAHYPVGYPALLALSYRLAGWAGARPCPRPYPRWEGGSTLSGRPGALAAYRLARSATRPRWALAAGLAVALHPGMVLYTPALMTEGVTAALLTLAAWMASLRFAARGHLLGAHHGSGDLGPPPIVALGTCWGLMSAPHQGLAARVRRAVLATALALAVCAPWTLRNCVRMKQCALVSFNGGWNLLIGASEQATGSWAPIDVPLPCRTVWDEAGKDACFGQEARRAILRDPVRWLGLVPRRLAATFDYAGGGRFLPSPIRTPKRSTSNTRRG